jgi:cytochrome b-561 domain-containing protein 2
MVVHIASVLLTGFFVYLAVPGSDLFSWHPTCMSVAYILLLLQVTLKMLLAF